MPRTKVSKNRSKTTHTDYASQIAKKQETICFSEYWDRIHHRQHWYFEDWLEREKVCFEEGRKKVASLEAKKAKADAKAAEEAKKAEAEAVLKKLLASGMSADEILEKSK